MSDTPRTDALIQKLFRQPFDYQREITLLERHAIKLERENTALKAELSFHKETITMESNAGLAVSNGLRIENELLLAEVEKLRYQLAAAKKYLQ